ncbi:actin cytoskeleton organization protein App1 [Aspergillus sclerotioniger CBS 115572]|uniref:Actin cytoskeleton organization protein App1 n=1 Tax=Aspergillus sclerotioniger CBS 115572 TaxID=1450535 RepID=A0A317UYF5_9EURO|nr:actin cytoskeleton organization protein App1 [Aspergillus sclerotioniger CBS 115572]PWY66389.1 actin cytoskeleton organization protein App1 [Aspergillus sclerotioniger CBS 115572]
MSQYDPSSSPAWGSNTGRERGARRKKVFDYLKAANELRQTYTAQWSAQINGQRDYENYHDAPGAFPDVEIARSEFEEMVIFPSYARRVVKDGRSDPYSSRRRGSNATIEEYRDESDGFGSAMPAWDELEDENAIVAVDVRGWVYAPHRGPMTRKHRLMVALARKLSGVPAPVNNSSDESNGTNQRSDRDDELVDTEAQSIIRKAEGGADSAWKDSAEMPPGRSLQRTATSGSTNVPLTKDEISVANAHLMERLRPFLTNPATNIPVTVFFFNDEKSQSRSVMTDESGHFQLRAGLPFIPTHVRVLASEDLSAVKEVRIIEPTGVSLISDIDDTVKHSAIASGAKEMFRNTFVRELNELTVDGVTEWYNKLAKMGVDLHYVSNAPWQLYPLLDRYFKLAGLPPGSFHLKQYSGMLQGIFEPTAERKRGSLEQILRDFPTRKFILVGDSGEADLEVYTDIVLANPGRILGIFIRDVTTTDRKKFFEKSVDHLEHDLTRSRSTSRLVDDPNSMDKRPALPPRRPRETVGPPADTVSLDNADLIDLRDEVEQKIPLADMRKPSIGRLPPAKPSKPSSLRSVSTNPDIGRGDQPSFQETVKRKPVPPLPPRRSSMKPDTSPEGLSSSSSENNTSGSMKQLPIRPKPGMQEAMSTSQDVNDTRPPRSKQPPPPPPPRRANTVASTEDFVPHQGTNRPEPQKQSYPASAATAAGAALQYASERLNWSSTPSSVLRSTQSNSSLSRSNTSVDSNSNPTAAPLPNKREELWRRRWGRAQDLLENQGVVLGSWRVGQDAQDVSAWLVEEAMKDIRRG